MKFCSVDLREHFGERESWYLMSLALKTCRQYNMTKRYTDRSGRFRLAWLSHYDSDEFRSTVKNIIASKPHGAPEHRRHKKLKSMEKAIMKFCDDIKHAVNRTETSIKRKN